MVSTLRFIMPKITSFISTITPEHVFISSLRRSLISASVFSRYPDVLQQRNHTNVHYPLKNMMAAIFLSFFLALLQHSIKTECIQSVQHDDVWVCRKTSAKARPFTQPLSHRHHHMWVAVRNGHLRSKPWGRFLAPKLSHYLEHWHLILKFDTQLCTQFHLPANAHPGSKR